MQGRLAGIREGSDYSTQGKEFRVELANDQIFAQYISLYLGSRRLTKAMARGSQDISPITH
jgi:hypothetical protein